VVVPKQLKKGQFLIREGEIPRYGAFVCRGFLRSYFVDNKGKEHVVQFAPGKLVDKCEALGQVRMRPLRFLSMLLKIQIFF
jgi:CRP-like cAMP-binding protein